MNQKVKYFNFSALYSKESELRIKIHRRLIEKFSNLPITNSLSIYVYLESHKNEPKISKK